MTHLTSGGGNAERVGGQEKGGGKKRERERELKREENAKLRMENMGGEREKAGQSEEGMRG